MAKVNLSKEEVEQVLIALANVITIKHRYRDVYLNNSRLNIEMIREVKIIRGLEDRQPRVGNCGCCND
jgi:hypothetical protein